MTETIWKEFNSSQIKDYEWHLAILDFKSAIIQIKHDWCCSLECILIASGETKWLSFIKACLSVLEGL